MTPEGAQSPAVDLQALFAYHLHESEHGACSPSVRKDLRTHPVPLSTRQGDAHFRDV